MKVCGGLDSFVEDPYEIRWVTNSELTYMAALSSATSPARTLLMMQLHNVLRIFTRFTSLVHFPYFKVAARSRR